CVNKLFNRSAKWGRLPALLRKSADEGSKRVTRVGVIRYAANPAGIAAFSAIQNAAQSLGLLVSPINVRDPREISSRSSSRSAPKALRRGAGAIPPLPAKTR